MSEPQKMARRAIGSVCTTILRYNPEARGFRIKQKLYKTTEPVNIIVAYTQFGIPSLHKNKKDDTKHPSLVQQIRFGKLINFKREIHSFEDFRFSKICKNIVHIA